jgi:phage terminase Nu1 subunit (DNA packaging protein)
LTAVRHEQAARLRRLNELEAGRLAPIEEVARRWSEIASQIRTGLLSVPSRIGARFPGQPDFVRAVDEEIRLALNDLADDRDGGL